MAGASAADMQAGAYLKQNRQGHATACCTMAGMGHLLPARQHNDLPHHSMPDRDKGQGGGDTGSTFYKLATAFAFLACIGIFGTEKKIIMASAAITSPSQPCVGHLTPSGLPVAKPATTSLCSLSPTPQ